MGAPLAAAYAWVEDLTNPWLALEDRSIEWICSIPPVKRRRWAIRLVLAMIPAEAATHVGMEVLPIRFFQHVLMLVSFGAMYFTGFDYVATTDVKVDTAEE